MLETVKIYKTYTFITVKLLSKTIEKACFLVLLVLVVVFLLL